MKTNLLQLERKHPKWFYFLYGDELANRYMRRVVAEARGRISREKDEAWEKQDRDKYDLLTLVDEMCQTLFDEI